MTERPDNDAHFQGLQEAMEGLANAINEDYKQREEMIALIEKTIIERIEHDNQRLERRLNEALERIRAAFLKR